MKALCFLFLLLPGLALGENSPPSPAEPEQIFIQAYEAWHKADRSEFRGDRDEARGYYDQSDELLRLLESKFPEWNKQIVAYRANVVRNALKRIGLKREAEAAPASTAKAASTEVFVVEPDEIFLSAYTTYQAGEKLEQQEAKTEALEKYREAGELLALLRQRYSGWNPSIVQYRAKRVGEAFARLK